MKRWLPSPLMTVSLWVMWLLLNESLNPAQILLGLGFALFLPWLAKPLMPIEVHIRQPAALARLALFALVEIVRSCINVSRIILFAKRAGLNSQFITVPLDLRQPAGLAVLSCIINSTPGTVWVEILPDTHELALHVFDLHDADWWVKTIKTRYEQPLIDIFEGGQK